MTPTKVYVDAEAAAKAWAKADADINTASGGRVFLGFNNDAPLPQLVVGRVGGSVDPSEAPLDAPVISFSCWAANRMAAAALAYTVLSAAESMTASPTPMGSGAVGYGARCVLPPLYQTSEADELAHKYRYVVDVAFVIRAA